MKLIGKQKNSYGQLYTPCYEAFEYELMIKWAESTAETVMWGDKNSGLSKVSGGKHAYTDGFPFTSYWRYSYGHIYTCNNFLDNYDKAEIEQDVKDEYAAEVKVIRAWLYFMLTTFYGDVPWVDHVITADEAYVPRTSRNQIIDYLMNDLEWAASKLPEERQLGTNVGRIDRWGGIGYASTYSIAK